MKAARAAREIKNDGGAALATVEAMATVKGIGVPMPMIEKKGGGEATKWEP